MSSRRSGVSVGLVGMLAGVLYLGACHEDHSVPVVASGAPPAASTQAAAPAAAADQHDGEECSHGDKGCGGDSQALQHPEIVYREDSAGRKVAHAGAEFSDAQQVTVAKVLDEGSGLQGKKVRIEGEVSAMCHHKRSWFAVKSSDEGGATIRVFTRPAFLVPPGTIGKTVRVEGTIEGVQVSPGMARHLSKDHKVPQPKVAEQATTQWVLRATAADFI